MRFALIRLSTDVPSADMARLAMAARVYGKKVAKAWGLLAPEVAYFPDAKVAPDGWIPAVFAARMDEADALAYHAVDPQGRAYLMQALSAIPNGVVMRDPSGKGESLCGAFLHEIAETLVDEDANLWSQGKIVDPETKKAHTLVAREACDTVQGFTVASKLADSTVYDLPDFVLPPFFDAEMIGEPDQPMSYCAQGGGTLGATRAFQVCPGGYAIVADEVKEGQIFARKRILHPDVKPAAWREAMRNHPARRSNRRAG